MTASAFPALAETTLYSPRPPAGPKARPGYFPAYVILWQLLGAIVPLWLAWRENKGKEERPRLGERYGRTNVARPAGKIFWVHAASVGEANAILPLVLRLIDEHPNWHALMTTGTVSSARLLADKLPERAIHQYIPLDHPAYVKRFLNHWQPDIVLWSESELWPNLLAGVAARHTPFWLVNGRMSPRSFARWRNVPKIAANLLSVFSGIYAGSTRDAEHYSVLASPANVPVQFVGNLKYDVPELEVDAHSLLQLQENIGNRPVLLAASLHPGEDLPVAELHRRLKMRFPDLLTILVPRHAPRGDAIAELLNREGIQLAQRSRFEAITPHVEMYLADTMGELGLFYRLARVAFIGGSLVPHGGQNPLEPVRLGVPVLAGLYMQNFSQICEVLEQAGAIKRLLDLDALAQETELLFTDAALRHARAEAGKTALNMQSGALTRLSQHLGATMERL